MRSIFCVQANIRSFRVIPLRNAGKRRRSEKNRATARVALPCYGFCGIGQTVSSVVPSEGVVVSASEVVSVMVATPSVMVTV